MLAKDSVPDCEPDAVGANCTWSMQDCAGVRLNAVAAQVPPGTKANGVPTVTAVTSRFVEPVLVNQTCCAGDCAATDTDPKFNAVRSLLIPGDATLVASPDSAMDSRDGVPLLETLSDPALAPDAEGVKRTSIVQEAA